MATTDFPAEISSLRSTYSSITEVVDIDALRAEVAQLNEQAAAPDLWDDVENAQKLTSQLSHKQSQLKRLDALGERIEDIEVMVQPVSYTHLTLPTICSV